MPRGMWDLPGPELEPVSPALAGGFKTTAPPGKPLNESLSKQRNGKKGVKMWSTQMSDTLIMRRVTKSIRT